MKDIAILIPVHNHLSYTRSCLSVLKESIGMVDASRIHFSIIVIDDGSSDGTSEWITSNHPDVIVLKGDGNLWWTGGVNLGARHAMDVLGSDYILLWNNDIEAASDYFSELGKIVTHLSDGTIAGSKIYKKEGRNVLWSYGGVFNPRTGVKYMPGFNKPDGPPYDQPAEADWLPGMGTLLPASVIRTIGYWDEKEFPQYHGDSDFTYRASLAGFKIMVFPQLRIWNDTSNTGLAHRGSLKVLFRLLTDIKSNYNLRKNIRFYRKYSTSIRAWGFLMKVYYMLFGGFLKWRFLSLFGVRKEQ